MSSTLPKRDPGTTVLTQDELLQRVQGLRQNAQHFFGFGEAELQSAPETVHWKNAVNRSCGDSITLALQEQSQASRRMVFGGYFCALCHAAAELICRGYQKQLGSVLIPWPQELAMPVELEEIFHSLRALPSRKKCAALPWDLVTDLLQGVQVKQALNPTQTLCHQRIQNP